MTSTTISESAPQMAVELEQLGVLARQRACTEARMVEKVTEIVARVSADLLIDKGFTSVEELTAREKKVWRAEAKRITVEEVHLTTGSGPYHARILVGLACAPATTRALVVNALDAGWVSWFQVSKYWERCAALPHDVAELVAQALFGPDPSHATADRLDPDGELIDGPWQHALYQAALEREAVAAEGSDVTAERERRRRAYADRKTSMRLDKDGTGTLTVTGPLTTMIGIGQRLDGAARQLRREGDPRTLDQCRADLAGMLLLHGTIPTLATDEADLDDAGREEIARILAAQPKIEIRLIVPTTALLDPDTLTPHKGQGKEPEEATSTGVPGSWGTVGEIIGPHPVFITPGMARELALAPGTVLRRLLTDPIDGRLADYSVNTYQPDRLLRELIRAHDVYSRAPGKRQPATTCELDHVIPYGPPAFGRTALGNLVPLGKADHDPKTRRRVHTAINLRRDLRWTTYLGQTFTTRSHDYRQYTSTAAARAAREAGQEAALRDFLTTKINDLTPLDPAQAGLHPAERTDLDARRDLATQALYAALTHRAPGDLLAAEDDTHDPTDGGTRWAWIVPRQVVGRSSSISKLGMVGSAPA